MKCGLRSSVALGFLTYFGVWNNKCTDVLGERAVSFFRVTEFGSGGASLTVKMYAVFFSETSE